MSGGLAFVYDVNNRFEIMCNTEMVDLDPVGDSDVAVLHDLISKHFQHTNSTVAKFILHDLDNQLRNFVKVFPKEYKKALEQLSYTNVAKIEKDNF